MGDKTPFVPLECLYEYTLFADLLGTAFTVLRKLSEAPFSVGLDLEQGPAA